MNIQQLINKYEVQLKELNARLEKNLGQASELRIAGMIDALENVINDLKLLK